MRNIQPSPDEIINFLESVNSTESLMLAGRIQRLGVDGAPYIGSKNALDALDAEFGNHPLLNKVRSEHMADGNCSWSSIYIDFIERLIESAEDTP